jgi:hypothetical protein
MAPLTSFIGHYPRLETHLEGQIARGEISMSRLTFEGQCFLRQGIRPPLAGC